ncbi:MAG TPA: hypothetical protein VGS10_24445 [Terracidiphilus sp.]|nr:hypothetical protein [Terracidiphilus sp.]
MEPALRPMSLGEILDRTAQLYRSNFMLFAGIFVPYAGCALVLGLLSLGLREWLRAAHLLRALLWVQLTLIGIEWLFLFLAAGAAVAATNRAVAWVHLGERATIRGAYQSILPRLGRYLWLMTVIFLITLTPIAVLYLGFFGEAAYFRIGFRAPAAAGAHHPATDPHTLMLFGIVTMIVGLLMIPAIVYAVLMSLRYALALPACVLEDLKTGNALQRGIDLSKGARGRIFVLGLLVGVIKLGVVSVSQAFYFVAAFRHHGQVGAGLTAISQVIGFFTNTFLGPIYATGITLLYYDQRVRHEGYDIEWMMQSAGLAPPSAAAQTWAPGSRETGMQPEPGAETTFEVDAAVQHQEPEGAHG